MTISVCALKIMRAFCLWLVWHLLSHSTSLSTEIYMMLIPAVKSPGASTRFAENVNWHCNVMSFTWSATPEKTRNSSAPTYDTCSFYKVHRLCAVSLEKSHLCKFILQCQNELQAMKVKNAVSSCSNFFFPAEGFKAFHYPLLCWSRMFHCLRLCLHSYGIPNRGSLKCVTIILLQLEHVQVWYI